MRFRDVVQTTTKLGVLTETHNYQLANRIMSTFGQKQKGQEDYASHQKAPEEKASNCPQNNIID